MSPSVPAAPLALWLGILVIGALLIWGQRKGRADRLSAAVLTSLVTLGLSQPHNSQAEPVERVLELQGSPARLVLNGQASERIVVRNAGAQSLRLDRLSIDGAAKELRLFVPEAKGAVPACITGLVLAASQTCAIEVIASSYFSLQTNDIIKINLSELHPTQPSVGYDQIYYHLARKQPDLQRFTSGSTNYTRQTERTELKRAQDYCEDTGRGTATNYQVGNVSLINGTGFNCTVSDTEIHSDALKTVVVGPNGKLYLTDGHHSFTTLWELKDGGPNLPVFVRVAANFSDSQNLDSFWSKMQANHYAWLFNAQGAAITPEQLPASLGLASLADDPYRSLVYLTRGMGYKNTNVPEFAEFYWGLWLRNQGMNIHDYDLLDLTPAGVVVQGTNQETADTGSTQSHVAAVRDAALAMRQLTPGAEIGPGMTGKQLGQNTGAMSQSDWDTLLKEEIWQDDARESDNRYRNGGKAWYAVGWRTCGAPVDNPTCWQDKMIVDHQTGQ